MSTYAFGDGDLAVERMATVAEVFAPSSARFLAGGALEFLRWRVTDPVGDHRLVDGGEVLQVAGGGASRARWTCERRG